MSQDHCERSAFACGDRMIDHFAEIDAIISGFAREKIPAVVEPVDHKYVVKDAMCYQVYPFISGACLTAVEMNAVQLQRVGDLLSQLHHCQLDCHAPSAFKRFHPNSDWQRFVNQYFPQHQALLLILAEQCQSRSLDPCHAVISHRDITPEQFSLVPGASLFN